jgi:hypothetical protein
VKTLTKIGTGTFSKNYLQIDTGTFNKNLTTKKELELSVKILTTCK